jgi:glycosyltransferase involved in cell wall biosynthesis
MANILFINANMGKPQMHKDSGGAIRTMALVEALSQEHQVTFLSFGWNPGNKEEKVNNNLTYIYSGAEPRVAQLKMRTWERVSKNPDLCVKLLYKHLTVNRNKVKQLAQNADLVVLEHYSGAPFLNEIEGTPIVYSSQNCEIFMAKQIFGERSEAAEITEKMESFALSKADALLYCSHEDLVKLQEHYGIACPAYYVPNGADEKTRTKIDIRSKSKSLFFVGSGHPPNIEAAKAVVPIARMMPEYTFNLCGSASNGLGIKKELMPSNLNVLGRVSDEELDMLFRDSLAFINPMKSGSGTHLKMMEALAYGIPIVTSAVGARGFSESDMQQAMIVADTTEEMILAIESLSKDSVYKDLLEGSQNIFGHYDWKNIQARFLITIQEILNNANVYETPKNLSNAEKKSVLIYSIVRNMGQGANRYYNQIKAIVDASPEYDFYLSIYENDSTDKTKSLLLSKDWSFFKGISIITENINTKLYGSVKDAQRVENLANARNKAIEAAGFIDRVDYVLMIEGDNSFKVEAARHLLTFRELVPDFDIVSAVSIRPTGTHYDWWATRTTPFFNPNSSDLDPEYSSKEYGEYYSTSNGLCLYRAKPFQDGIRHGWINSLTNEFDCEMVVLCQNFRNAGYNNIYINYKSLSYH